MCRALQFMLKLFGRDKAAINNNFRLIFSNLPPEENVIEVSELILSSN